ncbi:M14-type cytosolic carboxypeptidase [Caballeronia sordidicola]|uniref:M14-type cytosolic carboxypeptidase n=1 Tax=Caballeronia sordidicola TaxID=196367 RepID=UPI00094CAD0B|nr:M14-type cytosolic carboxypeptidase [Caballeronia sordidicola]
MDEIQAGEAKDKRINRFKLRWRRDRGYISSSSADVRLRVASDSRSTVKQWFYFRVSGARGELLTLSFDNDGDCTYTAGWSDYKIVVSYDGENWFRVPTRFDGQTLRLRLEAKFDYIYFAYFGPYYEIRRAKFLGTPRTIPG